MVDGLEKTYREEMDFHQKDYSTASSKADIKRFGIKGQHGMVILGADGSPAWTEGGHDQKREVVEGEVQRILSLNSEGEGG